MELTLLDNFTEHSTMKLSETSKTFYGTGYYNHAISIIVFDSCT